jgi:hypothetical protein
MQNSRIPHRVPLRFTFLSRLDFFVVVCCCFYICVCLRLSTARSGVCVGIRVASWGSNGQQNPRCFFFPNRIKLSKMLSSVLVHSADLTTWCCPYIPPPIYPWPIVFHTEHFFFSLFSIGEGVSMNSRVDCPATIIWNESHEGYHTQIGEEEEVYSIYPYNSL